MNFVNFVNFVIFWALGKTCNRTYGEKNGLGSVALGCASLPRTKPHPTNTKTCSFCCKPQALSFPINIR